MRASLLLILYCIMVSSLAALPCPGDPMGIATVAGNGTNGYTGDGGPATSAQITTVADVALDSDGNLYLADQGSSTIRRIDAVTGIITTIAGNGAPGFAPDGMPAASVSINQPTAVAVGPNGDVYYTERGIYRVRKVVAATGRLASIAGNGTNTFAGDGGPATDASFSDPGDLAVDIDGNIYISDATDNRVRRVDAVTRIITTVAGPGTPGNVGDRGPATSAWLNRPTGIALGADRTLYIAEYFGRRIRHVLPEGTIETVAGNGTAGFSGDGGPATSAQISPWSVVTDLAGNIFIIDQANQRLRMVDNASRVITTIAGDGTGGYAGDGGPASAARINGPQGAAMDAAGNLLFSDTNNDRTRMICAIGAAGRELTHTVPDCGESTPAGATYIGWSGGGWLRWDLEFCPDSSFDSLVAPVVRYPNLVDTMHIAMLETGDWLWRVRGYALNGLAGNWSVPCILFVTGPIVPPILLEPPCAEWFIGDSVTFRWTQSGYPYSDIIIASDSLFDNIIGGEMMLTDTFFTWTDARPPHAWWRVRGEEGVFRTFWSPTCELLTPAMPNPVSPCAETLIVNRIHFSWQDAGVEARYRVQIARDAAFTDLYFASDTFRTSGMDLYMGTPGDFYWRVQAYLGPDETEWGTACTYTIVPSGVDDDATIRGSGLNAAIHPQPVGDRLTLAVAPLRAGQMHLELLSLPDGRSACALERGISAGPQEVRWDLPGRDALPNGLYLLRVRIGGQERVLRVVVVR